MSETVRRRGTLTLISVKGTIEETAQLILLKHGIVEDTDYSDFVDQLRNELYGKVILLGEKFYNITKDEIDTSEFLNATKRSNGVIDFDVMYHNGGAGLDEVIEEAYKKMK